MSSKKAKPPVTRPVVQTRETPRSNDPSKGTAASKGSFSLNTKLAVLLGILSFVVYANTLKNGFVLDDTVVITKNAYVSQGIPGIPEIMATPYRSGFEKTINDLYRPLTLVMFAVEYQFFGKSPMPYHFVNILLFAGCVILLFFFLDKLFEQKKTAVAFIAALLFALHPIHTEVVANVKSGDELLCFFCSFLSLNVFLKYLQSGKTTQLLLGCFCYFLALLSKETVITFLAVIPLIFYFYKTDNKTRGLYITLSVVGVAVIFLAIRFSVLSSNHANQLTAIDIIDNALAKPGLSFASRVATAILILGYYIKLLFVPYPLISDYSYNTIPFETFTSPLVLLSLAAYVFLIVFAIKRFLKNHSDPYAFAILFFLITISLFTNIFFLLGTTMGERLIFFPSVSFCLIAALVIERFIGKSEPINVAILKQPQVLGTLLAISVIYGVIVVNRNTDWESNYTLYSADTKKAPNSAKLNYWLGLEMEMNVAEDEKDPAKKKQIFDEAITHLLKSLALDPAFVDAQITVGHAYAHNYQYDSAALHDRLAMELAPSRVDPVNNLAGVYFNTRKFPEAINMYRKAIALKPDYVNPYANLAACYGTLGKFDSTIYYARAATSVDPDFNASYEILASTFKIVGRIDSAKKYEVIAQKNNPAFRL